MTPRQNGRKRLVLTANTGRNGSPMNAVWAVKHVFYTKLLTFNYHTKYSTSLISNLKANN